MLEKVINVFCTGNGRQVGIAPQNGVRSIKWKVKETFNTRDEILHKMSPTSQKNDRQEM